MYLYIFIVIQAGLTPSYYMTNYCQKSIYANQSLVLDLTEMLEKDRTVLGYVSCEVTLQAPPDAHLFLHVIQLAISDDPELPDRY